MLSTMYINIGKNLKLRLNTSKYILLLQIPKDEIKYMLHL
jgi:hypothetical protein